MDGEILPPRTANEPNVTFTMQVPKSLADELARRAAAFGLSRNQYLRIVSEAALRDPSPLVVYGSGGQVQPAVPMELTKEAYEFLLSAVPDMLAHERRQKGEPAPASLQLPEPPQNLKQSDLWSLFEEERDQILLHKYYESQKCGHDIGMEAALRNWLQEHHDKWKDSLPRKD